MKLHNLTHLLSGGHAPVVQRLLELPQGKIDFNSKDGQGNTGFILFIVKGGHFTKTGAW